MGTCGKFISYVSFHWKPINFGVQPLQVHFVHAVDLSVYFADKHREMNLCNQYFRAFKMVALTA